MVTLKGSNLFLPQFELIHDLVFIQLPSDVFPDLFLVQAYGTDTVSFCPKVSSPIPFLEFSMPIEYLDSTLPFHKTYYL